MKTRIIKILISTLAMATILSGCKSDTLETEMAEITQDIITTTESLAPADPTAAPEPTLSPEIASLPISMQTITDELPKNYEYINEEGKLIIHHQFGDVIYEGVTLAGTNEWGYTVFYNDKSKQECWVIEDLEIGIIEHDLEAPVPSKRISELPTFSNEEIELAWHAKNRDIVPIMIVLDELNVEWNSICKKEIF